MTDKPERPPDWSDEEWAEYQAWHESLPEDVEREGSRNAVIIGRQSAPGDLLIVITPCQIELVTREEMESWGDIPKAYSIIDPRRDLPKSNATR